jgi:hypothetical protein
MFKQSANCKERSRLHRVSRVQYSTAQNNRLGSVIIQSQHQKNPYSIKVNKKRHTHKGKHQPEDPQIISFGFEVRSAGPP